MSSSSLKTVALLGANGQIGAAILAALLDPPTQGYAPRVRVLVPPGEDEPETHGHAEIVRVDYKTASRAELAQALRGVDAVVSALNGPGIERQYDLLEACIDAGVKRFIPSEFGFHQLYRAPGEPGAQLHPMWDTKERFNEYMRLHCAGVADGRITYTLVGAGDFYDQTRETFWCPWMHDQQSYSLPAIGDATQPADWSSITDNGRFVAAVLAHPEETANKQLNFVSWTASQTAFAEALRAHYPDREVTERKISEEDAHRFVKDPDAAPKELKESTSFPVDFWFTVRSIQGEGRGRHPRADIHNDMFPEVKVTTFPEFLKRHTPVK